MIEFSESQVADMRFVISAIRRDLERLDALFSMKKAETVRLVMPVKPHAASPPRRSVRPSADDTEACYRMFDAGRSRYDVSVSFGITFLSANRRYMGWLRAGGRSRKRA
jgi:hypothetical protein